MIICPTVSLFSEKKIRFPSKYKLKEINILATVEEIHVFKMRITKMSDTVTVKTGGQRVDFKTIVVKKKSLLVKTLDHDRRTLESTIERGLHEKYKLTGLRIRSVSVK